MIDAQGLVDAVIQRLGVRFSCLIKPAEARRFTLHVPGMD